ncbi:hypothetical protein TorRG33x02_357720, partial [Trema orientale]
MLQLTFPSETQWHQQRGFDAPTRTRHEGFGAWTLRAYLSEPEKKEKKKKEMTTGMATGLRSCPSDWKPFSWSSYCSCWRRPFLGFPPLVPRTAGDLRTRDLGSRKRKRLGRRCSGGRHCRLWKHRTGGALGIVRKEEERPWKKGKGRRR